MGFSTYRVNQTDQLASDALQNLVRERFTMESLNEIVKGYQGDMFQQFLLIKLHESVCDSPNLPIKVCERILRIFFRIMSSSNCYSEYQVEESIRVALIDMKEAKLLNSYGDKYDDKSKIMDVKVAFALLGEEVEWNLEFKIHVMKSEIILTHINSTTF